MCGSGGSTPKPAPPPAAPPPPPPAPKPLQTAIASDDSSTKLKGRASLRIDRTTGVDGSVGSGLNIPV